MGKMKRKDLVKAAKELNEVLELDPPIDTKLSATKLEAKLQEAVAMMEEDDEITGPTSVTLRAMGAVLPGDEDPTEDDDDVPEEEPEDDDPEDDDPEDEDEDAAAAKKKAAAAKKKKADAKPKKVVEKNTFGRRKGTKADAMDAMFEKGTTIKKAVTRLVKKFPEKTEGQATSMIKAHVRDFDKITPGFKLKEDEKKGIFTAVASKK